MKTAKKLLLALFVVTIFLVPSTKTEVFANEWVYDELDVVSENTKELVKSYNEDIFSTYTRKPQLGIMVIDSLPSGYTMDEFKLEMFNKLGVGTAEENCGMLFVFAVSDRLYGLEIGEGFERGSVLRQDLETDFISESTKEMLRNGQYDRVIYLITEYLASLMEDAENGVYIWKEQERLLKQQEEQRRQAELEVKIAKGFYELTLIVAYVVAGVLALAIVLASGYGVIELVRNMKRKRVAEELVEQNYRHVRLLNVPQERIIDYIRYTRSEIATNELEEEFVSLLYDLYCNEAENYFDNGELAHAPGVYMEYFKECNTCDNFKAGMVMDRDRIISDVNQREERKLNILHENHRKIREFVNSKASELAELDIPSERMTESLIAQCRYGDGELSLPVLRNRYRTEIKEQKLKSAYERFLIENQDKIDSKYFDSREFFSIVKNSEEGKDYSATNYSWMLPLLMLHMSDRRHAEEVRIARQKKDRAEAAKRSQNVTSSINNTSFGGGFGGGFSRGGGFSGGW